METEGNN